MWQMTTAAQHSVITHADADKVNLALRQVSHHLYIVAGDSTSRIPIVNQKDEVTFEVELGAKMNYDTLPHLVNQAFQDYGINEDYYVAVRNCQDSTILLGYNRLAYQQNEMACRGRAIDDYCSMLSITLQRMPIVPLKPEEGGSRWTAYIFGASMLGIGLLVMIFRSSKSNVEFNKTETPNEGRDTVLEIGNSIFDVQNLWFETNEERSDLTYREGKLLAYLVQHANQVLKRQDIQDHVWEEEGVIVGRSLDVFISRLRKLIKRDSTLKISNIHGVGYRLEVNQLSVD